ncbi:MAG: ATP-binding protein [Pseudomonadota bacterium]
MSVTIVLIVLDLSKIDADRLEIAPRPFALHDLLTGLADTWRETASAKDLYLHLDVDPAVPQRVVGDELRIRQVVGNLISNAVKFTAEGGLSVCVRHHRCARDGADVDVVAIAVTDTGPGIAPETAARIFDPFEQADRNTTREFGGTGLGLSISRRLARLMGGDVRLSSRAGEGATFTFEVPIDQVAAAEPESVARPAPAARLEGVRVLIVEDNEVNRLVAERFLKSVGAAFETASDGREALARLRAGPADFDVVLMDKHMPVMDGVDAMKAVRADDRFAPDLPIVACTADAMTGEREALLEAGFSGFLSKPIRQEGLVATLAEAIGGRNTAASSSAQAA